MQIHCLMPSRAATFGALLFCAALAGCAATAPRTEAGNARNVILFIGDGMGISTVTAARIFDGQSQGKDGEAHSLAFDGFPHVALVKTYNTNQQVPDSAGTATAIVTGTKTRAGVISVAPEVQRRSCEGALASPLRSIADIAAARGVAAGFVTTARVTHATPATLYAHSAERDWESDRFMSREDWQRGCRDIAWQLLNPEPGRALDVAMGGGGRSFYGRDHGGERRDPGADLVRDWLAAGDGRQFVDSADELAGLRPGDNVLGLFASSHMTYVAERADGTAEPSLSQMTVAAIDHLARDGRGYFLMVEGGRIDHGHHDGKPGYALLEAQEFNRAVEVALDRVDLDDTLILVTADHSHVFTMGGYPTRGNPILGLVVGNDTSGEPEAAPELAADGQPYTTLGYYNGPGAVTGSRPAPDTGVDALAQALVPISHRGIDGIVTNDETHGGEDVALYAIGARSDSVHGVIEQNRIFDIMLDAYGWRPVGEIGRAHV